MDRWTGGERIACAARGRSPFLRPSAGSTLFVTLITLAALSALAAYTFQRLSPSLSAAYQTAAWEEARLAAESGVDAAIGELLRNETGVATDTWEGWWMKGPDGRMRVPPGQMKKILEGDVKAIAKLLKKTGGDPPSPTNPGEPIFLDNLRVSAAGGIPAEMDVQLWALKPTDPGAKPWFRIRSMATCALPPTATTTRRSFDAVLRRFNLRQFRERVKQDDVGNATTIPLPNVSRTVEVLVEPITPFELALWAAQGIHLPTLGDWCLDSYDSRDPNKSNADGTYPGKSSPKLKDDAVVALNLARPGNSLVGSLIDARNATVRGIVATNGGDDPTTPERENVTGPAGIDPAKVRDDFVREMRPVVRPVGFTLSPLPAPGMAFLAGTDAQPTYYRVSGNLGGFVVAPLSPTETGGIVIMVDGDLNTADAPIVIPPNVAAELYVRGNINFWDKAINSGGGNSNRAAQLMIFGEDSGTGQRQLFARDGAVVHAAFYGPTYDVSMDGSVDWFGSLAARSFDAPHGGNGGLHYDRALALIGPPVSFRIVRYIEDVRQ